MAAPGRFKLPDGPLRIDPAHAGIFSGDKFEGVAAFFVRGLLLREKPSRDGVVDGRMQGIDAAGEQAVAGVEARVLHEVAQISLAARRMRSSGAAEGLI